MNIGKSVSTLAFLVSTLVLSASAQAAGDLYIVEPMVCKAVINQRPPGWADSYDKAGVKVTSFKSMRRDCTLADSSATNPEYFRADETITIDPKPEIAGWFDAPLKKYGNKVVLANGAWPGEVELMIVSSTPTFAGSTDILEGRQMILQKDGQDYYYDFKCEALVVPTASIIENYTSSCP